MPIQVVQGATVYLEAETLIDTLGAPVTNKVNGDWTKSCALLGVGTTVTLTITHVGGGVYSVSGTFPTAGTYAASYSVVVDGITQRFAQTVQVVTAAQADPASSIATQGLVLIQSGALVADAGALTIRRGDTTTWTIPLDTDITGYTLWFSVKTGRPSSPSADLDDSSALINAYWIDGGASDVRNTAGATIGTIEVDDPTEGTVVITLTPEYTTTLTGATGYSWEIQLENPDGAITTWTAGTLNVTLDLIRRTSTP